MCRNRGSRATDRNNPASRREFLTRIPTAAAMTAAATAVPYGSAAKAGQDPVGSGNGAAGVRAPDSFQVRLQAARTEAAVPIPKQTPNRDEQIYPNFIGNFSKGMTHNSIGEVNRGAYQLFLSAVRQGTAAAFEQIPLGGDTLPVNPLAGLAFDLEGTDSRQLAIPAFPSVAGQDLADQAVELYWMALCRDVNFTNYLSNSFAKLACAELSKLKSFTGPKSHGYVTPQTLLREFTAEDVIGPYVSQMTLKSIDYAPYAMTGQISTYMPGIDYSPTNLPGWRARTDNPRLSPMRTIR